MDRVTHTVAKRWPPAVRGRDPSGRRGRDARDPLRQEGRAADAGLRSLPAGGGARGARGAALPRQTTGTISSSICRPLRWRRCPSGSAPDRVVRACWFAGTLLLLVFLLRTSVDVAARAAPHARRAHRRDVRADGEVLRARDRARAGQHPDDGARRAGGGADARRTRDGRRACWSPRRSSSSRMRCC